MDIFQKINNGDYKTKLSFPSKPKEPEIFRKIVKNLSKEELLTITNVNDNYTKETADYITKVRAYKEDDARLYTEFIKDVEEEYGFANNTKKGKLWQVAYEKGHASGLYDILIYIVDLLPLIED